MVLASGAGLLLAPRSSFLVLFPIQHPSGAQSRGVNSQWISLSSVRGLLWVLEEGRDLIDGHENNRLRWEEMEDSGVTVLSPPKGYFKTNHRHKHTIFVYSRDKSREKKRSSIHLLNCSQQPRLAPAENRNPEFSAGLPEGLQQPDYLNHYCGLPWSVLTEGQNPQPEPGIGPRYSNVA